MSLKFSEGAMDTFTPLNKKITAAGVLFALAVIFLIILFYLPYHELERFLERKNSVAIYDRNGTLVQVTPLEQGIRREFTPFPQIPQAVKTAFIKAEDNHFYKHHGVDYGAVLRAARQNVSKMRKVSGASTITMQLARIISPSEKRNIWAKCKDVYNAYRIEHTLSKGEILEQYLNSIPFGYNVEGVTSGARFFFSKELEQLSMEEISSLALIPRNPSRYSPVARGAQPYEWPFFMPHLVEYVKSQTGSSFGTSMNRITLTADLDLQNFVNQQIYMAMEKGTRARIDNAAALVLDNRTGEVLAWVGSNSWFDMEHSGQIDGILVHNQMGSSMKPFLYAMAIDNGLDVNAALPDIPMDFGSETVYIPANFNNRFNGPVRLRNALASSLNVPAVYTLFTYGVENYYHCLMDLGFESLRDTGLNADLGLALGAGEVSLKELTAAFSIFPRDGLYLPVQCFEGQQQELNHKQIFSPDTSRIICSILSDKKARVGGFGYHQSFETEYPAIFKTGTANQYQNIVALGATPDYTVGVWMGNFSGNTVMGKTGSSLPAAVAKQVLDYLSAGTRKSFQEPEHYKKVKVCALSGKSPGECCPSVSEEYVSLDYLAGFEKEKCTWHVKQGGVIAVKYPAEYQKWVSSDFQNSSVDFTTAGLKIVTPTNKSRFFADQSSNKNQQLTVEVIGGADSTGALTAVLDKKSIYKVDRPFIFTIPVTAGAHTLDVTLGNESDSISFTVE